MARSGFHGGVLAEVCQGLLFRGFLRHQEAQNPTTLVRALKIDFAAVEESLNPKP